MPNRESIGSDNAKPRDLEEDNHGYSSYNSYTGQYDPGYYYTRDRQACTRVRSRGYSLGAQRLIWTLPQEKYYSLGRFYTGAATPTWDARLPQLKITVWNRARPTSVKDMRPKQCTDKSFSLSHGLQLCGYG